MGKLTGHLGRERHTMETMVAIYCADHHPDADSVPCEECRDFLAYAETRLAKCPFGQDKPTCARCPIHCYKPARREHARAVMRHAGPKMPLTHPWLTFTHMLDKLRRVEHPMLARRRRAVIRKQQEADRP